MVDWPVMDRDIGGAPPAPVRRTNRTATGCSVASSALDLGRRSGRTRTRRALAARGSPSAEWLEEVLAAERASITSHLEKRHRQLIRTMAEEQDASRNSPNSPTASGAFAWFGFRGQRSPDASETLSRFSRPAKVTKTLDASEAIDGFLDQTTPSKEATTLLHDVSAPVEEEEVGEEAKKGEVGSRPVTSPPKLGVTPSIKNAWGVDDPLRAVAADVDAELEMVRTTSIPSKPSAGDAPQKPSADAVRDGSQAGADAVLRIGRRAVTVPEANGGVKYPDGIPVNLDDLAAQDSTDTTSIRSPEKQLGESSSKMIASRSTYRHDSGRRASTSLFNKDSSCRDGEETPSSFVEQIVHNPKFELAVAGLIMANAIVMSFEVQYSGMKVGHALQYRWHDSPADQIWGSATGVFAGLDYLFGVCYIIELIVKMIGFRWTWFYEPWHYFDFIIVLLWLIERPLAGIFHLPMDIAVMRMARLFRLLRLVKVMRVLQGMDSLYLLLTTLKGSLVVLGWSCVLLLIVQMFIAMICWFILTETYFYNENNPIEERRMVFEYFGSFSRAMLTMFEMTLANWPPVCRLLVEYVNEWFMLFCIVHKLTIGFAVIGVINGVFMQETFRVASTDDRIMVRDREREVKIYAAKMKRFFEAADDSGDGCLDIDEFKAVMSDPGILFWLASMQITVRDPEKLYKLLDVDGDGELTCEEVVKGFMGLRGAAKTADILMIKQELGELRELLTKDAPDSESDSQDGGGDDDDAHDGNDGSDQASESQVDLPPHPSEVRVTVSE